MKNSKSSTCGNQNKDKVENNILYNNKHAFESGITNSSRISPEEFRSSSSYTSTWFPGSSNTAGEKSVIVK